MVDSEIPCGFVEQPDVNHCGDDLVLFHSLDGAIFCVFLVLFLCFGFRDELIKNGAYLVLRRKQLLSELALIYPVVRVGVLIIYIILLPDFLLKALSLHRLATISLLPYRSRIISI